MIQKIQQEQEKKLVELKRAVAEKKDASFDHEHTVFNQILKAHVKVLRNGQATTVDYAKIDKGQLDVYLKALSSVSRGQFNSMKRDEKLAFLINAYNAFTIDLIVRNPNINSIKDLGSFLSSPWKRKFISLFGEKLSLDEIEHGIIRKDPLFQEPRIHFAVNCASIGCPALAPEAFVASRLENQLEAVTKNFLSDRERNRVETKKSSSQKFSTGMPKTLKSFGKGLILSMNFYANIRQYLLTVQSKNNC
ncbi:MAG: DUF547 domain-containing protein [Bdellovibrionales bacterium]|nr:DUF547 domain-containing protein [Bdellovibrionales bacterium]